MNDVPATLVPPRSSVSNRTVIARLKAWGCTGEKQKGEYTYFDSPWGDRIEVKSATYHRKNGSRQWDSIVNGLRVSYQEFMARDLSPLDQDTLKAAAVMAKDFVEGLREQEAEEKARLAAREAEQQAKREQREVAAQAARQAREKRRMSAQRRQQQLAVVPDDEATAALTSEPKVRQGRIINQVLDFLIGCGEPCSIDRIMTSFDNPPRRSSVQGACLRLVDQGVVDKVKPGVYQAKPQHQRQDVRVGVQGAIDGGVAAKVQDIAHGPEKPVQEALPPMPVPRAGRFIPANLTDNEATINDVLDLMFPSGFKAKHLPLIDAWRTATIALMRDIEHG
jgi:hypothetical protein